MASFSAGGTEWSDKSTSNCYKLELTLTETAVDATNNESEISYELVLSSGPHNRFQWTVGSYIEINETRIDTGSEKKYLDYDESWTLLKGTTKVKHNDDGTMTLSIKAGIDDVMSQTSYGPPALTIAGTMDLTPIQVAPAACPIVFNGQAVTSIVFNGQPVEHLVYNGTQIF